MVSFNFLLPFFRRHHVFGPKFLSDPIIIWHKIYLDANYFWVQNFFGLTHLLTQIFLRHKILFYLRNFGPEICFDSNFVWTQNLLEPKIYLDTKIFLNLTFSLTQNFLGHKIFSDIEFILTKKGFCQNIVWTRINFFGCKLFFDQRIFGSQTLWIKHFFGPNIIFTWHFYEFLIFRTLNCFDPNIFFCITKLVLNKTIFAL